MSDLDEAAARARLHELRHGRARLEKKRDERARASVVISILASVPVWLTALATLFASSVWAVETGMEISIVAVACGGPMWLAGAGLALASLRVRAVAAALVYPLSWWVVMLMTS